ncbi:unnamed protein product [Cuscuta epithymum]|uniref:Uncharacterized protein n=1 Tax=Cuscuta epithymum TaxID=186058 RepID=A0AAV0EL50_9ASTE|nr:unnamed protein product [Cuscuta epithymum]
MHHDRPLSAIVSRFTVRLAHSPQDGDDRLMQYDRPLSAIVPSSRSGSARPSLPGWRQTSYASRSAPQRHRVQTHGSTRPFPPGWRRPSYAVRSAPQRHRTQLTFSSSIPSRVATNVLCITIGPSAPSCPDSRFGSPIPPRMATTVLCSTIGPSAPSYPTHVQLVHPFQGGDERLMHQDQPLSAIVSRLTVRLAHSLQDGDDRLMQYDRPLSAIVPSSRSARPSLPGVATNVLCITIGPSAPSCPDSRFGSPIPFQDGDDRLMQYDRPLSAIIPSSRSARPPSRVATNVLCITIGPSVPSCLDSRFGSPIPSRMAMTVLCSMIGPSAPSYPAHVQLVHPF